jgi:hypothetical protein
MGTWKRFWSLSRPNRGAALEAASAIVAARVALRTLGYPRWKAVLDRWLASGSSRNFPIDASGFAEAPAGVPSRVDLARMNAGAARRLFFHATCLERSIGLWWLLRRRGYDAEIFIGGRKEGGRFEAHAWVASGGGVLSDAGDEHLRFEAFGEAGARALAAREMR